MSGFKINKGSDLSFEFNWPDGAGGNLDLTDHSVDIYDASNALTPHISATLQDAAAGLIVVEMQWDDVMSSSGSMYFRVRITKGDFNLTTNQLRISVQ